MTASLKENKIFFQLVSYLQQCAFGGVEFSIAVDHSFHYWRIISYHQQSWAPEKSITYTYIPKQKFLQTFPL